MGTVAELRPQAASADPKPLPQAPEAEWAVVGGCLIDARAIDRVADIVQPEHFLGMGNRAIMAAVLELRRAGSPIDVVTVADALRAKGTLAEAGGAAQLADLIERTPTAANVAWYARRVRDCAERRRLISAAEEAALRARELDTPLGETVGNLAPALLDLRVADEAPRSLGEEIAAVVTEIDARADGRGVTGIPTGLAGIDRLLGGYHGGHLIVIAGRTSMGKTAYALGSAHHALRTGTPVGIVSCEMSRGELLERLIAQYAGVELAQIKRGYLNREALRRVHDAAAAIADWPLQIEDRERKWPAIELAMRRMVAAGARMLVVDYLGLLHLPGKLARWEQIAVITGDMKRLAKALDVPLLVLCQINREVAREKDKRPALWHLRDSGAVEQDADAVILLHRPAMVGEGFDREHAEAIVAKHRHGPTGTVNLRWVGEQAMFTDGLDDAWGEP